MGGRKSGRVLRLAQRRATPTGAACGKDASMGARPRPKPTAQQWWLSALWWVVLLVLSPLGWTGALCVACAS